MIDKEHCHGRSSRNKQQKNRKKLPLAAQIFIALILAIIVGLLMQKHFDIAVNYIKPQLRSAAGIIPDGYA